MELVDVRAKVSTKTHAALIAEERATGKTQSEVMRDVLAVWADERIHAATVLANLLRCEGTDKAGEGNR